MIDILIYNIYYNSRSENFYEAFVRSAWHKKTEEIVRGSSDAPV